MCSLSWHIGVNVSRFVMALYIYCVVNSDWYSRGSRMNAALSQLHHLLVTRCSVCVSSFSLFSSLMSVTLQWSSLTRRLYVYSNVDEMNYRRMYQFARLTRHVFKLIGALAWAIAKGQTCCTNNVVRQVRAQTRSDRVGHLTERRILKRRSSSKLVWNASLSNRMCAGRGHGSALKVVYSTRG